MNIKEALSTTISRITTSPSPVLDAEVLLSFVLNQPKEYLYTNPGYDLSPDEKVKLNQLTDRRRHGEPIAYLVNNKEFYGFNFYVDNRVLIPRPETEALVEEIISTAPEEVTVADIGTGSGCIAATIALSRQDLVVLATEISKPALAVAEKNVKNLKAAVELFEGDLLKPIISEKIDIIVANLPYVTAERLDQNPSLRFEPRTALFGGSFGLEAYIKLFQQIAELDYQPSQVMIEIDPEQSDALIDLVKPTFSTARFKIKKDLAGLDRFLIVQLA